MGQVESHILLPQNTLSDYCKEKGIFMTAYSPLGGQRAGVSVVLREPILKEIGDKYGRSAGTVSRISSTLIEGEEETDDSSVGVKGRAELVGTEG
jgi:hypothetical protein